MDALKLDGLSPQMTQIRNGKHDHNGLNLNTDSNSRLIYGAGTSKQDWMEWAGLRDLVKLEPEIAFPKNSRVVILSPHPDDEILGCAGLIQQLDQLGRQILVIGVTNGTQSHPNSKKYSSEQLHRLRPLEVRHALKTLKLQQEVEYISFCLADGNICHQQQYLQQNLKKTIQHNDILISTYEKDGHPDHEYLAKFVREFAQKNQLKHFQVLIWAWHWATPDDPQIEWALALRLDLNALELERKAKAIQCFKTQISADETTGSPAIVPAHVIDRILMPWEVFLYVQ